MTIYLVLRIEDGILTDEFAFLNQKEADDLYEKIAEEDEIDPDTGSNGDESVTLYHSTLEVKS